MMKMNRTINNQITNSRQQKIKDVVMEVDANDDSFQFSGDEGDIVDSGAIEHSSDSDYEPPMASISVKTTDKVMSGKEVFFHIYGTLCMLGESLGFNYNLYIFVFTYYFNTKLTLNIIYTD